MSYTKKLYPNIALLGATGCGKSSLINKLFGKEIAEISNNERGTTEFKLHNGEEYGVGINLVDGVGYELHNDSSEYVKTLEETMECLKYKNGEVIHLIWFCISIGKKRIEEMDIQILKKILKLDGIKERVFIIFTKSDKDDFEEETKKEYERILRKEFPNLKTYAISTTDKELEAETNEEIKKLEKDYLSSIDSEDIKESLKTAREHSEKTKKIALKNDIDYKRRVAEDKIRNYTIGAGAIGLTPIPFSDAALLIPIQLKMINDILEIYGMRDIVNIGKGVISQIIAATLGKSVAGGLLKMIPGIGTIIGGMINGGVSSAVTYGLGMTMLEICESNYEKIKMGRIVNLQEEFSVDKMTRGAIKYKEQYNS